LSRVISRLVACSAIALTAGLLTHASPAQAGPPLHAVSHGPTQGTPVPGAVLTADLGTWSAPPSSYSFEWLRDGVPIPGATAQKYDVQSSDVGDQIAPRVTGSDGPTQDSFTGEAVAVRKLGSSLTIDVRRVHPPGKNKLVWTAITFMSIERPWSTDGGTITAFKQKDGHLKALGQTTLERGAAFVRLPWKRAPLGKSQVLVCYAGSDAVETSCSPFDVVQREENQRGA
jgi:hypothetical protein